MGYWPQDTVLITVYKASKWWRFSLDSHESQALFFVFKK